jgi:hypothetical protein
MRGGEGSTTISYELLWNNSDGNLYTIPHEGKYAQHAGMKKWRNGEKWGYVSW